MKDRLTDRITPFPGIKHQVNSFVMHCGIQCIQCSVVYQENETGQGAHKTLCLMGNWCLSCT